MQRSTRTAARLLLAGMLVLGIALTRSARHPSALKGAGPSRVPVQTLAADERIGVRPGEKGATYYWLEEQSTRLTMRFGDAIVTTDRIAGGDLKTQLTDLSGNELATLSTDLVDTAATTLQYRTPDGGLLHAAGMPGLHPTLEWASRQAYSLFNDRVTGAGSALEWQGDLMRPTGARERDVDRNVIEIRTDWAGGRSATVTRKPVPRGVSYKGRPVRGDVVTSHLTVDGSPVGEARWYPALQLLMWNLPGHSEGYLGPEHLKEKFGGWPFTPDMPWMNLQLIAFHYFKAQIDGAGYVAELHADRPNPLVQFFVPRLLANTEGCDGFHWLDGTILRFCCDIHDACYAKAGCTASTWWMWWSSWSCNFCNMGVIGCFGSGGTGWPYLDYQM